MWFRKKKVTEKIGDQVKKRFRLTRLGRRARSLIRGEKRELRELRTGQESLPRFFKDSSRLFKNFFIPHQGNDHRPWSLRPKSLITYLLAALAVKFVVTGFLFFTYPTPAELAAIVSERMVNFINASRVEAGVEPLTVDPILIASASAKGQDMIDRNYFAHDTPEGKRPWQWIDRSQYDYVFAGENLAIDFKTAEVVHDALMKSPSHRRNILNERYSDVGIAVINGEFEDRPTILLVEFFGTQRSDFDTLARAQSITETAEVETESFPSSNVAGETTTATPIPEPTVQALAAGVSNEGVIVINAQQQGAKSLIDFVIEYSNIFFIAFLIFILISLLLNVLIKIKVQHSSVILQSVAVIALIAAIFLVKFHFTEQIIEPLLIL